MRISTENGHYSSNIYYVLLYVHGKYNNTSYANDAMTYAPATQGYHTRHFGAFGYYNFNIDISYMNNKNSVQATKLFKNLQSLLLSPFLLYNTYLRG